MQGRLPNLFVMCAGRRDVGQTIGFCRLSFSTPYPAVEGFTLDESETEAAAFTVWFRDTELAAASAESP
jgi:hypothetical protein